MINLAIFPILVFIASFTTLCFSAWIGAFIRTRSRRLKNAERQDLSLVLAATLTLLGLLIGFTFSMAVERHDLRKNYEQEEANAVGTAYLRADFLPPADAAKVRTLLKQYLQVRIIYYTTRNDSVAAKASADTANLQNQLWAVVRPIGEAQPNAVIALVVSSINDVLSAQTSAQAAWWNRLPVEAWWLMAIIAISCNILIGYDIESTTRGAYLILPAAVSISFLLVSDIDSPRGGTILVGSQNLTSLLQSMQGQ